MRGSPSLGPDLAAELPSTPAQAHLARGGSPPVLTRAWAPHGLGLGPPAGSCRAEPEGLHGASRCLLPPFLYQREIQVPLSNSLPGHITVAGGVGLLGPGPGKEPFIWKALSGATSCGSLDKLGSLGRHHRQKLRAWVWASPPAWSTLCVPEPGACWPQGSPPGLVHFVCP